MKTLLFILHFTYCGTDTLPTQKVLEASIDSFFAQKAQIEIVEFQTTNKYDWMKWLPSVGVGYALDGRPRPIANYSFDRNETLPSDYLKLKQANQVKHQELFLKQNALQLLEGEILNRYFWEG